MTAAQQVDVAAALLPDTARTEWLAWRRGGLGGSDIAALLGLSNYGSPWSLFVDKCGLLPDDESTQRQRIGTRMESVLAAEFHDMTGLCVVGVQTWCVMPGRSHFRCTVDGFAAEHTDSDAPVNDLAAMLGCVQMKTDGRFGWPEGPPANIRAQCVWEMGVTGLPHCWLVVMFAGFRIEVFEIDWDADAQADWALMAERAETFWTEHVVPGIPPPLDDSDATTAALRQVYPEHVGGVTADLDGLADIIAERADLKDAAKATKERLTLIDNTLKAALEDAEVGLLHGTPAFTYRSHERAEYTVSASTVRTLRPVKSKDTKK